MATIRVLLCCGAGFSSGFLAQKARQAAKKGKSTCPLKRAVRAW